MGTLIIYDISSTSSPIFQMIICIVKLDSLDYAIGLCNSRVFIGIAIMGYEP